MWRKIILGLALILAGIGGALLYGARRWRVSTEALIARLDASGSTARASRFDEKELEGLPSPVAKYFRRVLRPGQPLVTSARIRHEGLFRSRDAEDGWSPFSSTQLFRVGPPGFIWDARIRMAPGMSVQVRDSYVAGAGGMHGEVLELLPVVDLQGTPEMAAGSLQRYLAEAVWIPTALLPSQGVQWTALDDSTAQATLTDGQTTVSLDFTFNAEGEITRAFTPARFREVQGRFEPTPWECRYTEYADRGGMRIPLAGEVEWQLPNRRLPYWRGRVVSLETILNYPMT